MSGTELGTTIQSNYKARLKGAYYVALITFLALPGCGLANSPAFLPISCTFVLFSQGKYVPTISKKIHDENQSADFKINFKGLGIGNGAIDPPNSFEFGEYLYQVKDKIKDN